MKTDLEKILEMGVTFSLKKLILTTTSAIYIDRIFYPYDDVIFPIIKDPFKSEEEAYKRILFECKNISEKEILQSNVKKYDSIKNFKEILNEHNNRIKKYLNILNILNSP